jgi:hypothetical protein
MREEAVERTEAALTEPHTNGEGRGIPAASYQTLGILARGKDHGVQNSVKQRKILFFFPHDTRSHMSTYR